MPTISTARFKELVGDEYTVKDLRTWHGTVLAAAAFVDADPPVNKTVIKRVESAVMKEVSEELGNTPAVARSSYVDPRVVQGYEKGVTIAAGVRRANRTKNARRAASDPGGQHRPVDPQSGARLVRRRSSVFSLLPIGNPLIARGECPCEPIKRAKPQADPS